MFEGNGRVMDPVASLRLIEMWETLALRPTVLHATHNTLYTVITREKGDRKWRGRKVNNSAHFGQGRGWAAWTN
jgi:hypothetical protein